MNLGLCIANLLRRYPAVEVPGIGVFKITRVPASHDQEGSVFLPPTSHIELSEGPVDFFPIVNYLRAQRGVDEATAKDMLDKAVIDIFETITRNGQALLDGVGYLVADGVSFVFKPFDTGTMEMKPVILSPSETAKDISAQKSIDEIASLPEDVGEDDAEETTVSPGRSHIARWMIVAALILVVSAAAAMWYYKSAWFDGEKREQLLAQTEEAGGLVNQDVPPGQATSAADTAADSVLIDQLRTKVVDSVRADTVAVPVSKPPKPAVTYEIIVGSFATMAQARKYVAEMKAKGYDLQALDSRMPGNRKKISWGSYATEEEAYRELVRVQKNFEPGAWIAKVEND